MRKEKRTKGRFFLFVRFCEADRKIAEGDTNKLGDISTLLDPEIVAEIKKDALPET